jgi:hypothetical protein
MEKGKICADFLQLLFFLATLGREFKEKGQINHSPHRI